VSAHDADVLVLGGGPAGAWAAISAARTGARVVLADKGYLGTSGAAAAGGNNLWFVPPVERERDASIRQREVMGGHLTDRGWMERVVDITWRQIEQLAAWGYPFPTDRRGVERRSSLQGPQYMRLMRLQVRRAGVKIIDQSPSLELLVDADGVVSGAAGVHRQRGNEPWTVTAGAVVLATGGCAFLSGALGCNPDTGDGHLMAAELGAELSGMEFSSVYGMAPAFGAQTKGRMYQFARYYRADGTLFEVPPGFAGRHVINRALLQERVFARLDLVPEEHRATLRWAQPNFFLPFDKAKVDPFTDRFEIRLVLEGTVRGTGGIAIVGDGCETTVPGLYAAGDAATRELVTGAVSGGGSHNGAWAISSGVISGAAAAAFARRPIGGTAAAGRHGLGRDSTSGKTGVAPAEVITAVKAEVEPLDRNLFRTGSGLADSLLRLEDLWRAAVPGLDADAGPQKAREAAALVAHARWMYHAALARKESRIIHRRDDLPDTDERQARRLRTRGLDHVEVTPERAGPLLSDDVRADRAGQELVS